MKQLTRFFFVALLLLAAGISAGDAQAQNRTYTSVNGKAPTSDVDNCTNPADPCKLADVLANDNISGGTTDTVVVLVSAPGAMLDVKDALSLDGAVPIGFYMNDGNPTAFVGGTLKVSGNLTLTAKGILTTAGEKTALIVTSPRLMIAPSASANLPGAVTISEPGRLVRIEQTNGSNCLMFDDLTIAGRTQITPMACAKDEEVITITGSLTVNAQLQLQGNPVLNVTAMPTAKNLDKSFVAVNSSDGIESFGGKLRLAVGGYAEPAFDAVKDTDVYKDKKCFSVRGSGPIELDLEVTTPQYICIGVPKIGAGGTSTIYAGTVALSSSTLDGSLRNSGAARVDVSSGLMLMGDLTIDGRWTTAGDMATFNPILDAAGDGIVTPAEYAASVMTQLNSMLDAPVVAVDSTNMMGHTMIKSCAADRRPGVHLHAGATIEGDVTFQNIHRQDMPNYMNATMTGQFAVPCQSGLFLQDSGTTTVEGMLVAQELDPKSGDPVKSAVNTLGGYVYLGNAGKAYHNLVLEGDVDISGTLTNVDMAMAAGGASINGCSMAQSAAGTAGNKVILGGSNYQVVKFSTDIANTATAPADNSIDRTLSLAALTINKSGGSVEFTEGSAGVSVAYLEPLNGMLSTGSALSAGSLLDVGSIVYHGGSGTVDNAGGGNAYRTSPSSIVYAGGDHMIGDERGSAADVTILSSGVVSMKKGSIGTLKLIAGTLKALGEITVGTLEVGNTGMLDLSEGSLKHTGTLLYNGDMERDAGMAWMATAEMPAKATDKRQIIIRQDCGKDLKKPTLQVNLNPGYTAISGELAVWRGTLDLNGGTLVIENRVGGDQWISTGQYQNPDAHFGQIIDSQGAAYEDELKKGDELFAALEAVREDNSEENQAALDKAVNALKSSSDAKTNSGGGIRIGWVEPDKDKIPTTNIAIYTKENNFPPVTVVGGKVYLMGTDDGDEKLSMSSLSIGGDKNTYVSTGSDLELLQVGNLMISAGQLSLNGKKTLVSDHMQTASEVTIGLTGGDKWGRPPSSESYSITGMFSVGEKSKVTFGDALTLSLAGDVMVSGTLGIPAGNVTEFIGSGEPQMVSNTSTLGNVTINAGGGLMLGTDVKQAATSTLTLQRGIVMTGDSSWVIKNPNIEQDLAMRSAVPEDTMGATIFLGNRASFVDGAVSREVNQGNSGMGNEKGGYLFPVGKMSTTTGGRNRYRPLILNFATDLSPTLTATTASLYEGKVMWPAEGIDIPAVGGGTTTLDTYSDIMWMVEMSGIPALGATVRVAADGITGVNDSNGLRLVQWDCDGSNARLAGEFDLSGAGLDAGSVSVNGRINGVPNTTMDGIDLAECSIFGLAANHAENPIGDGPPPATPQANVQLIHNIVGATVDVYLGDVRLVDNFAFQTATSLSTQVSAGEHTVHVVAANAPDNSNPLATIPVTLAAGGMYTVIANGDLMNFDFAMLANTRSEASADSKVEFRVVHGAASLGEVDLRSLTESGRWANNIDFNEATGYRTADAIVHNVELLKGHDQVDVFELDFGDYINQTLVLALSGAGMNSSTGLTLMGVATDGSVFFPQVVTSAHAEELPTEFALQGNYPNPFNPSTQIQFDLPATAEVTVQVVDLLGRMVLRLPAQSVEAGANRTVELDGSSLASGTYLYRLIADMESGVQIETGRMVLIK